ncbi:hypothetical protein [Desulfoluna butyratoxydans]|uniref:hypothetical protein n=1 Tax=Desulfoluna butyratoxydans TaxID=231438 RepID=UPI0015D22057|nr:hypothetical protein [Desulfoluna butyratoxydans]
MNYVIFEDAVMPVKKRGKENTMSIVRECQYKGGSDLFGLTPRKGRGIGQRHRPLSDDFGSINPWQW